MTEREGWLAHRRVGLVTLWWAIFTWVMSEGLVDQNSVSWNRLLLWLREIEVLRQAAGCSSSFGTGPLCVGVWPIRLARPVALRPVV
jgi:hypothetical protein